MDAQVNVSPWEREQREGEEAYAAFLAYRDLGPRRSHEATRVQLGKRPGYIKPIERWSTLRQWRHRARAWDDHLQAERDKVAREEAEKWERRRLQALEDGWKTCQALRARLERMLAEAPEAPPSVATSGPSEGTPEAVATPAEAETKAKRGSTRSNYLTLVRLSKMIVEQEWAILNVVLPPPGMINPLTATPRELDDFLALQPRFNRPPPRGTG